MAAQQAQPSDKVHEYHLGTTPIMKTVHSLKTKLGVVAANSPSSSTPYMYGCSARQDPSASSLGQPHESPSLVSRQSRNNVD
ncbi:hypothetical protein N7537_003195 [Penicillium hordei]|uniref:Uncharacterized protein n=1 Tax=Penicillium hordei TaxID=40994 RepID=A0AAD6H9K2_9EURO|nr:uncharacterized protein N7537_003195 [Penicillium hordei]KAJ5618081.1 hypothetical protein N7537_003195 [Penicillium hordei]